VFVIGGERVYKDALAHPSLRKIIATVLTVHSVPDADASFPPLSTTSRALHTVDQSDEMEDRGVAYRYVTYALA
jgi:dihydrofolate reductase